MSNARAEQFFDGIIRKYNCGDIQKLLSLKLDHAGPLLACVVSGIDALGGMIYGFREGSCSRSTCFMVKFMGVKQDQAKLLYRIVRCGMCHEYVPKLALRFFVLYEEVDGELLYKSNNGVLWLNVVQLARNYLRAADSIGSGRRDVLIHVPESEDANLFASVWRSDLSEIEKLCGLVAAKQREPQECRCARGEIESMSSASPFLPERLSGMTIPPPGEAGAHLEQR